MSPDYGKTYRQRRCENQADGTHSQVQNDADR